jgi:rhodanese-related sulfurtransferase
MKNRWLSWLYAALLAVLTATAAPGQDPGTPSAGQLPKEKQTTPGLYVTAREAYEKWRAAPDKVKVLDVRTPEEFILIGHAAMAWNIPLAFQTFEWDSARKHFAMKPNPDFVAQVKELSAPGDTLLVMCRSGNRSARAVNLLAAAGFQDVWNVTDGMEGDLVDDPASVFHGQRMKNGWKNSGLPSTYQVDPGRMRLPKHPGPEAEAVTPPAAGAGAEPTQK